MEREISSATWMAVSLMALAAFIGIVMWTVSVGNSTKRQAMDFGSELAYSMESGEIQALTNTCTDMSMAAAYNILTRNYINISEIQIYRCTASDLSTVITDFESKLKEDSTIAGTTKTTWKTNKKGYWTVNGSDTATDRVLLAYEVLMEEGLLSGRGYIGVNKLPSDTFRVKILFYNN